VVIQYLYRASYTFLSQQVIDNIISDHIKQLSLLLLLKCLCWFFEILTFGISDKQIAIICKLYISSEIKIMKVRSENILYISFINCNWNNLMYVLLFDRMCYNDKYLRIILKLNLTSFGIALFYMKLIGKVFFSLYTQRILMFSYKFKFIIKVYFCLEFEKYFY